MHDQLPAIDGLTALWGRPCCHGRELRDQALAILVLGRPRDLFLAIQLTHLSGDVVACLDGGPELALKSRPCSRPLESRCALSASRASRLTATASTLDRAGLFVHPPWRQAADLAGEPGCRVLEGGTLAVDGLGQTSVPGIYAIGDMARRETMLPGHQVAAAAAEGSLTAIAIDPISSSAISRGCDRMNDSRNPMTERVHHPLFARAYTRIAAHAEGRGAADHRRQLLAGLTGRVIEVGAGSGANFPYYPGTVDEVVACEPEPYLRAQAAEAATHTALPITVIDGVADVLPVPSESFDAAVVALVLCTVPDVPSALAEVRRVLKPGGELRFYEHVVSDRPVTARLQQLADATFWPRVAGGCHMSRDTAAAISDSGFRIEQCDRFPFSPIRFLPSDPHILGVARRG